MVKQLMRRAIVLLVHGNGGKFSAVENRFAGPTCFCQDGAANSKVKAVERAPALIFFVCDAAGERVNVHVEAQVSILLLINLSQFSFLFRHQQYRDKYVVMLPTFDLLE